MPSPRISPKFEIFPKIRYSPKFEITQFTVTVEDGATVLNLAEEIAKKKPAIAPGSMILVAFFEALKTALSPAYTYLRCLLCKENIDRANERKTVKDYSTLTLE